MQYTRTHIITLKAFIYLICPAIILLSQGFSQNTPSIFSDHADILFQNAKINYTDSGIVITEIKKRKCKANFYEEVFFKNPATAVVVAAKEPVTAVLKPKFLVVHGNLTYNFNYRSYIDTPFAEYDMMQHSVQTRLNVKLKDKYPFTVYLTSRRSNSPFFSNATDVSFQFRQAEMLEDIKRKMRTEAESILLEKRLLLTPAQIYQREKEGILKPGSFSIPDINNAAGKIANAKKNGDRRKI